MKIVIAGYFGFHNTGDEAILSALISTLIKIRPGLKFCVVSGDPIQTKATLGVETVYWRDLSQIIDRINESDLVLLGGGGIFNDYWGVKLDTILTGEHAGISFYSEFAILAKLLNKPFAIFSTGIGPVISKEGRDLTQLSFSLAGYASVRDVESKRLLQHLGCEIEKIPVTGDPGFLLDADKQGARKMITDLIPQNGLALVSVCLRNWDIYCDQAEWQNRLAKGLDEFVLKHPCNLLFIPFHNLPEYPLTNDPSVNDIVASKMQNKNNTFIVKEAYSPAIIAGLVAESELLVGMRLHSIIFAANAGVPVVAVAYDLKVRQMMRKLGIEKFCFDLNYLTSLKLTSTMEEAILEKNQIQLKLGKKCSVIRQSVEKDCKHLVDFAEKNFGMSTVKSRESELLDQITINQARSLDEERKILTGLQIKNAEQANSIDHFIQTASGLQLQLNKAQEQLKENKNEILNIQKKLLAYEKENKLLKTNLIHRDELLLKTATEIKNITKRINEKDLKIKLQTKDNVEKDNIIQGYQEHLASISRSRGWRLLQWLWDIRLKLIPKESWREKRLKSVWHFFHGRPKLKSGKETVLPPKIFRNEYLEQDSSIVTLYTDDPNVLSGYPLRKRLSSKKPDDLKVTLIASVKNEISNIENWLEDIRNQTRLPDEIVIVDGGSTDGTLEKLFLKKKTFLIPLQVVSAPRTNRSEARNLAIKKAQYPLIAVTDFGCHIHSEWLEKLIKPFTIDPEIRVSAGFYQCVDDKGHSEKKDRLWANLNKVNPQHFLPSSRSVAFTRETVEAVGGHPEWLVTTGDDTYLDLELKRLGGKWAFVPEALVDWHAPNSFGSYLKKNYLWAIGDGESGVHARYYWRYMVRIFKWLMASVFAIAVILTFLLVPIKSGWFWALLIVVVYIAGFWIISGKARLGLGLMIQKMLGEIAQVCGFIKGARQREKVEQLRFVNIKNVVFILAGVPIDDTGGGSRGAQITYELLRQGYGVVYIHNFPRNESTDLKINYVHPNLFCYPLNGFNLEKFIKDHQGLMQGRKPAAIIEFPLADFLPLINEIKTQQGKVIYDLLDDWQTALGGNWYSSDTENRIIDASDELVATVPSLQKHLSKFTHRPSTLIPNAVNDHLYNYDETCERPNALPPNKRIITYIGALWGEWFDWKLLEKIAGKNGKAIVCVIGDYRYQLKNPPSNLLFLGLMAQNELPAYLKYSDVAIIPWKKNKITEATSPLKLYEYLAMHCPVIAPDLSPLRNIPGTFLAKNEEEYLELVEKISRSNLDTAIIQEFIQKNNWESRVKQFIDLIEK